MSRKRYLCVLALIAVAAGPTPPAPAIPPPLLAAIPPGPVHDPLRRALLKPYAEASQTEFADPAWDGRTTESLKTIAPDIALVSGEQLVAACRSGQFRKLDWGRLNRDRYLGLATSDCGVGAYLTTTALVFDRDKFTSPPQWADFWDVARHPGRRGLQRTARGNLEIALLADGVSPNDVYRTLRSSDGLDRAFRKLDQLKSFIQWWDQPSQATQWLAGGKVLLTSGPTTGLATPHGHLTAQWAGSLVQAVSFVVPQNAPHPGAGAIALLLASDPARQAQFAQATGLGPTTHDAVDLLPDAARAQSPSATNNLQPALAMDEAFWADNHAKLDARFAAWLAK